MQNTILLRMLMILFLSQSWLEISAQNPSTKFGEISDAEWAMTNCEFDTSAAALILMDYGQVKFNEYDASLHYHRRIKLFSENAYDHAAIQIPFYKNRNLEEITALKAFTFIKQKDGTVKRIEVTEFFDEALNEYWSRKKFTFPGLQPGAIIEYSYTLITPRVRHLKPWFFQGETPRLFSKFKMGKSKYFQYAIIGNGTQFAEKYKDVEFIRSWELEKLPGYANEVFVICPENYLEQVRFQLKSYLEHGRRVAVLSNWKMLRENIFEDYSNIIRKGKKNKDVEKLISPSDSKREKAKIIFEYMKQEFAWNGFYGIYPNDSFKHFIKTKTGNVADLNIYMLGLLKKVGVEAHPFLISTKENGQPLTDFPLLKQFNRVICYLEVEEDTLLMDLGQEGNYLPFDLLPYSDFNYYGLILNKEPEWIEMIAPIFNKISKSINLDFSNGKGSLKARYTGYFASNIRERINNDETLLDSKNLEGMAGQEIILLEDEVTFKHKADLALPVQIEIPIQLGELDLEEDFLYFIPRSWTNYGQNPFGEKNRVLPIEFNYGKTLQHIIIIHPPKGYIVEERPEDLALKLPGNLGKFTYFTQEGQKGEIIINFTFKLTATMMSAKAYPYLKEIYTQLSEKLGEAVVFKRE